MMIQLAKDAGNFNEITDTGKICVCLYHNYGLKWYTRMLQVHRDYTTETPLIEN